MKNKISRDFMFSRDYLIDKLSSKEVYLERMAEEGVDDLRIRSFESDASEMSIKFEREVEINTKSAPKFIQKIADRFLKGNAVINSEMHWDKKSGVGVTKISAKGMPVSTKIIMNIKSKSENSSRIEGEIMIRADIPLVGKQLEKFMMPKAEKAVLRDLEKTESFLLSNYPEQ